MSSTSKIYDAVVIGSGLAGLGAAYTLKNANRTFIVLEAQNYVGGRVKSQQMKVFKTQNNFKETDGLIELGAQWLHGVQNDLHRIADENNLLRPEESEEALGSYIREDGYVFDEFFHKRIDFEIGQILTKCIDFRSNDVENCPKSVEDFLDQEFQKYVDKIGTEEEKEMAYQIYDWHKRFEIIDNSCLSLKALSAKYWGMYSFNGESCQAHINFKNGFSSVVDIIVKEIGAENIKLNSTVVEIDWDIFKKDKDLVSVRTACGETYMTKHVLVTCSLGVLKMCHEKLFRPILPEPIHTAIDQIGFETINKIFLQFEYPWWHPMEGIQLIFNSSSDYSNAKWTRYLTGFDILYPGAPNTLVGWVGSYGAIEMEKCSDEQIAEDCVELLRKFTKLEVPFPVKFACSRWNSNEFVRGGYSYLSTKCDESGYSGATLSTPITTNDLRIRSSDLLQTFNNLAISENATNGLAMKNGIATKSDSSTQSDSQCKDARPILLFAGEACHSKYFSTAHGAFLSGIEQAQTILKYA